MLYFLHIRGNYWALFCDPRAYEESAKTVTGWDRISAAWGLLMFTKFGSVWKTKSDFLR